MLATCKRERERRAAREQVVSAAIVGGLVEVGIEMAKLDGGMEVR